MTTLLDQTHDLLFDQLNRLEGKAEIVNGSINLIAPTGEEPGIVGGEIFGCLREYARRTRQGRAVPDNVGFSAHLAIV